MLNSSNMFYDINEMNLQVSAILTHTGLDQHNNNFFKRANENLTININSAFNIAYHWREITKTFLFTSLKGLGALANKIGKEKNPSEILLLVLQNCFSIVSDDLNSTHVSFKKSRGINGIHYKWWEESILNPIQKKMDNIHIKNLPLGIALLLSQMQKISTHHFGIAIQLRVVEAIAFNICKSFLTLFSNIKLSRKIFF